MAAAKKVKYSKMDPAIKRKWIKALRSGKYRQGKGELYVKDTNKYCCLGVLREIKTGKKQVQVPYKYYGASCGVKRGAQRKLARLNDGEYCHRLTFPKIATWISKNL